MNEWYHKMYRMKKSPTVSIVTGTLNPDLRIFEKSLRSIKEQTYKHVVEHIVLDGGSKKEAIRLARSYGCTVAVYKENELDGGARIYRYGVNRIKGDLILLLPSDNILPDKNFLAGLVEPFSDTRVFATYPAYNTATKDMDILTRYFALIGAPDPTLYYLHKSDKVPVIQKHYDRGHILKETPQYWIVKFDKFSLPTVGDNGYLVKKSVFAKITDLPTRHYIHLDAFMYFLEQGHDTYGVVKNSIIHVSRPNILEQVRRRVEVKRQFSDNLRGKRAYLVFNWHNSRDWQRLILYVIYSLTIVQPALFSVKGFLYVRDSAWFLHPVMCFLMVLAYGMSELTYHVYEQIQKITRTV